MTLWTLQRATNIFLKAFFPGEVLTELKSNTRVGAAGAGGQREAAGDGAAAADTDRHRHALVHRPDHLKVSSLNGPRGLKLLGW